MLDIKLIRADVDLVIKKLNNRGKDFSYLKDIITLDKEKRDLLGKVEKLKSERNEKSALIGKYKREKKDTKEIFDSMNDIGDSIKDFDAKLNIVDEKISDILNSTPNIPADDIVIGDSEADNKVIKNVGDIKEFDFKPLPHWDLVEHLNIVDFDRAAKITGSRFAVLKGHGAKLERALMNFFLDQNELHGYTEVMTPQLVNSKSLYGTGNLPKFSEDLFKLKDSDYYLIPTAEVPITNLHANEVVNVDKPIMYTGFSACFRSEAGSAGRDTRGIIRQHQFNKVEIVNFTKPCDSDEALEGIIRTAENLLELLKLPYRRVELCTADISFSSKKTYDLEVWLPSYGEYKEISSCSNFGDFQARRANIKYKDENKKNQFVHTLNGSSLALGRTFAAIIENYQTSDKTVVIPEVLVPYMNNITTIKV